MMTGSVTRRTVYSRRSLPVLGLPGCLAALTIPLVVVACTTMPQAGAANGDPTQAAAAPPPPKPAVPSDPFAYYHFILGHQAELGQDHEQAITEYLSTMRSDPSSVFIKARLASLYLSKGDAAAALRFADRVAESDTKEPSILLSVAGVYAASAHVDQALALYDRAIAAGGEGGDPYFAKGILLMNLKRYEEARQAFDAGVQKSGGSPMGFYYLGRIGLELKEYDAAVDAFERAIAVNPGFEPAYIALASVHEARQDGQRAAAVYRRYLQAVNPNSKEVRQHLVRLFLHDKRYKEALAELEQILTQDPDDLDAQLRVGLVYGETKEYAKAIAQLNRVLTARPGELRVRDYLGMIYEEQKEYEKAIQAYQENLRIQPTYADGHMHMGFLLYKLKRYPEAIGHLTQVLKLEGRHADAYLLLGLTYLQTEDYTKATETFEAGVRENPDNPDLHFNLGTAYDKQNRFDDLVRAMEAALRIDPKHADALNYLGYTYAERGVRIEEAVSLTQRAVALKPNNGYYVDSLGWAFYKMGKLNEALAEIKRAAALVQDDPVIFEHLGEIYLKQNLMPEAREAWLRSLSLDPSNTKLADRYRAQGWGDPMQDERVRQAQRRVSQNSQAPKSSTH